MRGFAISQRAFVSVISSSGSAGDLISMLFWPLPQDCSRECGKLVPSDFSPEIYPTDKRTDSLLAGWLTRCV